MDLKYIDIKPIIICVILITVISIITIIIRNAKISKLRRSEEIYIGMDEDEMLSIMGGGYTRSLLKNNRTKYEWRMNATSYTSSYKGGNSTSYSGVKKATIYVKDGYVEEVKGFNLY